jgi:hypothetical protein
MTMRRFALLGSLLLALPAAAQTPAAPSLSTAPPPVAQESVTLKLSAAFAGGRPIASGLVWRVYDDRGDQTQPTLLQRSDEAAPSLALPPGSYTVHVAYGFAGATRRVTLTSGTVGEQLTLNAGALKLGGAIGDLPIPPNRLAFSVFVPLGTNSEGRLVRSGVKAGDLIRLPEGTYHVVSTYGESNAIMRADLKVDTGRITEATLNHRAATVVLKLVGAAGGEAIAGTAFSVLTPGGDVIREAIGAFPSVTLAEGDYVLIARHEGEVFTREFKVESGRDTDVEVLAKK